MKAPLLGRLDGGAEALGLSADTVLEADPADRGIMARALGLMFVAGALTGSVGAASVDGGAHLGSWLSAAAAGALGIGVLIARDRLTGAAVIAGLFLASAMVSAALTFDADDSARILYVLPLVLMGAFGSMRWLLALVAFTGAGYALALLSVVPSDPVDADVGAWVNVVGVSFVAGGVVHLVKQRLDVHLRAVVVMARALDLRDSGTAAHSETVGRYSALAAERLGLAPWRVRRVRLAGILHDIGKIGVSDTILNKPGPLDEGEWEQMRRHPDFGAELLHGAGLDRIAEWVRAHHERPDGLGYPDGIGAAEIPLEARILAVADTYEAMIADRCYRAGIGHLAACEELQRVAGTQLDPDVVEAFLDGLNDELGELGIERPSPALEASPV